MTIMSLAKFTDLSSIFISVVGHAHDVTFLKNDVCIRQIETSVCYYIEAYYSIVIIIKTLIL